MIVTIIFFGGLTCLLYAGAIGALSQWEYQQVRKAIIYISIGLIISIALLIIGIREYGIQKLNEGIKEGRDVAKNVKLTSLK